MLRLRELILESAEELRILAELEETLKWGGPSILTISTIRIDWKGKRLINMLHSSNAASILS
ncbi:MAG: hypothetical protein ACI9UR_002678 [Bacteroidia bacterium]|jgi:hypothetical protein